MKMDKELGLTILAGVFTLAAALTGVFARRAGDERAAHVLPKYDNIDQIVIKKES